MFGMNKIERLSQPGVIRGPEYKFTRQGTLIFLTGVPLSGKSTIASLIASSIKGCTLQPMDIIRLVAQEIESHKPEGKRSPFVNYGSCDSYAAIEDGSYSPQSLLLGFNAYSEIVSSPLRNIIPKLEVQGAQNVLFEGVQLTPSIVMSYLNSNSKLIITTSNAQKLESNRRKMFGDNTELTERYSTDRLLLLQEEILKQSREIPEDKVAYIDNTGDYRNTIANTLQFLLDTSVIEPGS